MVAFVDALTEPEAPELTIEKLVGVYRVLIPHKIAAYTYHLNNTSQITDAPTIRSLGFILQDELDDWRDGEMLIQSLIETPAEVERAARPPGPARDADARGRWHRRARLDRLPEPGGSGLMRRFFPRRGARPRRAVQQVTMRERMTDPRAAAADASRAPSSPGARPTASRPSRKDASDAARALMHGIFVGEIQALEGAGRTCFDFDVDGQGRRRRAPTRCRSPSSSTWPASAGTRPATSRSR